MPTTTAQFYKTSTIWNFENYPQLVSLSSVGRQVYADFTFSNPELPSIKWGLSFYPVGHKEFGHVAVYVFLKECPQAELKAKYCITILNHQKSGLTTFAKGGAGWGSDVVGLNKACLHNTLKIEVTVEHEWGMKSSAQGQVVQVGQSNLGLQRMLHHPDLRTASIAFREDYADVGLRVGGQTRDALWNATKEVRPDLKVGDPPLLFGTEAELRKMLDK